MTRRQLIVFGFYATREESSLSDDILTFMAPHDSRVEIWGNELYGPKLEERIRVSSDSEDSPLVA